MILRRWVNLSEGRVVGFFPEQGVYKGKTILVDGERCKVTKVDRKRNRIKVKRERSDRFCP